MTSVKHLVQFTLMINIGVVIAIVVRRLQEDQWT